MINIGEIIRQHVKEQGLTVSDVAARVGYSRTAIYKIYARKTIDTDTLLSFSKALNYNFFGIYIDEISSGR